MEVLLGWLIGTGREETSGESNKGALCSETLRAIALLHACTHPFLAYSSPDFSPDLALGRSYLDHMLFHLGSFLISVLLPPCPPPHSNVVRTGRGPTTEVA